MSIFQCAKCGCADNTACGGTGNTSYMLNCDFKEHKAKHSKKFPDNTFLALVSYKEVMGLKPEEPFGKYCVACSPVWYTDKGEFGIGAIPEDKKTNKDSYDTVGMWHNIFPRRFFPKGKFYTNKVGNLAHIETDTDDIKKYQLEKEEGT